MLVNTESNSDLLLASRLNSSASKTADPLMQPAVNNNSSASRTAELDQSLQRLSNIEIEAEQDKYQIQDSAAADSTLSAVTQGILTQSDTAMAAQANQLSDNVLSLLQ